MLFHSHRLENQVNKQGPCHLYKKAKRSWQLALSPTAEFKSLDISEETRYVTLTFRPTERT
jgi:hypothetical protein